LAEIRRSRGLTQRQLASAIGVTLTSLQNYERGRNAITARRLDALALALRCKPIDLRLPSGSSFILDCANDRGEYGAASTSGDRL
jgi:transcriptional regulator with XRE-family HTH domain